MDIEHDIANKVISIDIIKPHKRNYRHHPDSQIIKLGASHSRFGQFRSVVLWERPNGEYVTVAGHGIIEAMRRNGVTSVRADVLPSSTPQEEIDAILVADNLHAQSAQDDESLLLALLQEQQEAGYDLTSLGSDDHALEDMLAKLTPPTLEELEEEYGDEPEEGAFWPTIRVKVSPETKELYESLMEDAEGTDESAKFAWLLERVDMAMEDEEDDE